MNKIILITRASSGLGASLCDHYASPNVDMILLARREEMLESVAKRCRLKGARVFTYQCDVTNQEKMSLMAKDVIANVGCPDIIIANAGVRFEEGENFENLHSYSSNIEVNYYGVVNTFLPFIPIFKIKNKGHFVSISSIGALRATPNSGAYSASKAALNLWTESLRLRLKIHNIVVTNICLGFVDTSMTSSLDFWMPGMLSSDEAAKKISKAVESKKREVMLPFIARFIWTVFICMPGRLYDWFILLMREIIPKKNKK